MFIGTIEQNSEKTQLTIRDENQTMVAYSILDCLAPLNSISTELIIVKDVADKLPNEFSVFGPNGLEVAEVADGHYEGLEYNHSDISEEDVINIENEDWEQDDTDTDDIDLGYLDIPEIYDDEDEN